MNCVKTIFCLLCGSSVSNYHQDKNREYFQCSNCRLVFAHPDSFLSLSEEKSRYDLHQNSPDDEGYRKFLSRVCDPLVNTLPKGSRGLDFGCGPGPTLSVMFEELGYPMAIYDPFYAADKSVLEMEYDFVTSTEVVEHLQKPKESLNEMWQCVKPGGYLGIMSQMVIDAQAFKIWRYKQDDTHICFYSKETFNWLGLRWRTEPVLLGKDVVIFQKTK